MTSLKKVLIVDDSPQLHLTYKMVLMRYKCAIVSAMNGHEGLFKLSENPDVDLIILDMHMPLMSGLEFIKTARQRENGRRIPVILVSTKGRDDNTATGLPSGADVILEKPFTSSELHALIGMFHSPFVSPGVPKKAVDELRRAV